MGEIKYFDEESTFSIDESGHVYPSLNLVNVGVGNRQMIGKEIYIKSVELYFRFIIDERAPTTSIGQLNRSGNTFKWYLMLDKQCNGTIVTRSMIFDSNGVNSFVNRTNEMRFTIISEGEKNLQSEIDNYTEVSGGELTGTNINTATTAATELGIATTTTGTTSGYLYNPRVFTHYYYYPEKVGFHFEEVEINRIIEFSNQTGAIRALNQVKSNNLFVYIVSEKRNARVELKTRINYCDF